MNGTINPAAPSAAEITMKRRSDQFNPACVMRTDSGARLAFLDRASSCLSDPSTCSRRVFCAVRTWRAAIGWGRATLATRRSAARSPDRIG